MKIIKKALCPVFSLLTAVGLCVGICADGARITLSADAVPGGNTEIQITLENNPGLAFAVLDLSYDKSVFTLENVYDSGLLGDCMHSSDKTLEPYRLMWFNGTAKENFTDDGIIANITFSTAENAPGGEYEFSLSCAASNSLMNVDFDNVAAELVPCTVTVTGADASVTPSEAGPDIKASDGAVTPDQDEPVFIGSWSCPFVDVSASAWYYDDVRYVAEQGLMKGVSDTEFLPDDSVTRGMFVTMLYRMDGERAAGGCNFSDVPRGAWYEEAVSWA